MEDRCKRTTNTRTKHTVSLRSNNTESKYILTPVFCLLKNRFQTDVYLNVILFDLSLSKQFTIFKTYKLVYPSFWPRVPTITPSIMCASLYLIKSTRFLSSIEKHIIFFSQPLKFLYKKK